MRMTTILFAVASAIATQSAAQEARGAICVRNDSAHPYLFAVEARPEARAEGAASRRLADLAPGETLCTDAPAPGAKGVVSVYEGRDALEGCSRLVRAGPASAANAEGAGERLIRYADFDRCRWGAHD